MDNDMSPRVTHTGQMMRNMKCQFCRRNITFSQWFSQDCSHRDGGHLCLPAGPLNITIPSIEEAPDDPS